MTQRSELSRDEAPTDVFPQVGEAVDQLLEDAQAHARQIQSEALDAAQRDVADARREADQIRAAAVASAQELIRAAEAKAALLDDEVDEVRRRRMDQAEAALKSLTAQGEQAAEVLQTRIAQVRRQEQLAARHQLEVETLRREIAESRGSTETVTAGARNTIAQVEAQLAEAVEQRDKVWRSLAELAETLTALVSEQDGARAVPRGGDVRAVARRAAGRRPSPRYNWALAGVRVSGE